MAMRTGLYLTVILAFVIYLSIDIDPPEKRNSSAHVNSTEAFRVDSPKRQDEKTTINVDIETNSTRFVHPLDNFRGPMDDLLERSLLQPQWLAAHGFSVDSTALARLHALLDGRNIVHGLTTTHLRFTPGSNAHPNTELDVPRMSSHQRYIHTQLAAETTGAADSVILRWSRPGNSEILELSAQAVSRDTGEFIPLWQHTTRDWIPGRYRLEVITAGPELRLLAAGDFEITVPGTVQTPFAYSVASAAPSATDSGVR